MSRYFLFLFMFYSLQLHATALKPFTAFLKKGTLLVNLKDKSEFVLSKGIYAKVLESHPGSRTRFYVYDNSDVPKYETSGADIKEISDDINLLPDVNAQKFYPPKSVFKTTDKFALFESQMDLHFDNLQLTSFNNIYNDEISSALSNRYEIRTLYVSELPLNFGLTLNYQSAYWINDYEDVKLSILSFGPLFKYHLYQDDIFNVAATFDAELAPVYQGSTATYTDKYSAHLFDIGLESEWSTALGLFTIGSHFRHHEVALSETDRTELALIPQEFSVNSLGIMFGYKIEWEL